MNELERSVLAKLLGGKGPVMAALRRQAEVAQVKSREFTGHGVYTSFTVPPALRLTQAGDFFIGGVGAEIEGMLHGAGFHLFVTDGLIAQLEGYAYDEPWPASYVRFRLIDIPVGG